MRINNIRIIDPASDTDITGDIYINIGEETDELREALSREDAADPGTIDGTGLVVAPGLVDVHVHFRDPGFTYKEDIYTGAAAAAAGGFTTVVMMANTSPTISDTDTLRYVLDRADRTPIHVLTCATITEGLKGRNLTDMESLAHQGAVGFTDDGIPLKDPETVRRAMIRAASLHMPLSFHEEDPSYISENGINAGEASRHFGVTGSPREAEISMIRRDLEIMESLLDDPDTDTTPDIVIQHISTAEGVDLVRRARQNDPHIHAEATPHHFSLTEEALIEHGTLAKMNPPLRTEADRRAIIDGLADGTIELISTDHAPHSAEEKARAITDAPSGIIGLETSLSLGITNLVRPGHLTLPKLLHRMSTGPARIYGLDAGRLDLKPVVISEEASPTSGIYDLSGQDLVIFAPDETWIVPESGASKSVNSPFIGRTLFGRVHMTVCGGRIVYRVNKE